MGIGLGSRTSEDLTFQSTGRFIMTAMKIGELSNRAGYSTKTIRYYEEIGVIPAPERLANGYRDYDESAVDRLAFVRDAQAAGLSLNEIEWILGLKDQGASTCGHVVSLLESRISDIDRQLEELTRTKTRIEEITARARQMDPADCTDASACQTLTGAAHHTTGLS